MRVFLLLLAAVLIATGLARMAFAQVKTSPVPPEAVVAYIPPDKPPTLEDKFRKAALLYHRERREVLRLRRALRHSPSVSEALTIASVAYGVSRRELAAVAWCESTHRPHARNGQYRGIFQQGPMFEATPFGRAGLSVWSPYAAAMSTAYTVKQQGWRQWECKP